MEAAWLKTGGMPRGRQRLAAADIRMFRAADWIPPAANELPDEGDICCVSAAPMKRCGEDLLPRRRQRMSMRRMVREEERCVSNHPFRDHLRP